jgi:transcriptional regulator with XRE-family HTH domain
MDEFLFAVLGGEVELGVLLEPVPHVVASDPGVLGEDGDTGPGQIECMVCVVARAALRRPAAEHEQLGPVVPGVQNAARNAPEPPDLRVAPHHLAPAGTVEVHPVDHDRLRHVGDCAPPGKCSSQPTRPGGVKTPRGAVSERRRSCDCAHVSYISFLKDPFSEALSEACAVASVDATALSEHFSTSVRSVNCWLDGTSRPSPWTVSQLEDLLGVVSGSLVIHLPHNEAARDRLQQRSLDLAEVCRSYQARTGLTGAETAELAGVSPSQWSRWRNGTALPSDEALVRLADAGVATIRALTRAVLADERCPSSQQPPWLDLGVELMATRVQKGWSSTELATRLGVCSATIRRWEQGEGLPTPEALVLVSDRLEVPLEVLVGVLTTALGAPPPGAWESDVDPLSQLLRTLRAERGWTFDQLAQRAGLSRSRVAEYLSGAARPSMGSVMFLARNLGLDPVLVTRSAAAARGVFSSRTANG